MGICCAWEHVCRWDYWRVNINISMSMSVFMCVYLFLKNISIYVHIPLYIKVYAYMSACRTSSASDVVLLVFVLLVLGDFGDAQRLVLGAAVGLCGRVADVVAALIHVVGALVSIAVLVHGIEKYEDAESCRRHDPHYHACGAAAFPHHLGWTWKHLHSRLRRKGCNGREKAFEVTLPLTAYIINLHHM